MKKEMESGNYEKWCEQWREKFLKMDVEELKARLPELKDEGDYLTIAHFGREFAIGKADGTIKPLKDEEPVSNYEKLDIYTLFGYVSPGAHFQDDWVSFDKLKDMGPFFPAFQKGIIQPFARMFQGHTQKLEAAFRKLNGVKLPWSDVGYELRAFACIPIRFLFWEGDEEFPAQANVLFDASATDFIHGESIVTIASVGLDKIVRAAGVQRDRSAFSVF